MEKSIYRFVSQLPKIILFIKSLCKNIAPTGSFRAEKIKMIYKGGRNKKDLLRVREEAQVHPQTH